jgi:hypothetical protein
MVHAIITICMLVFKLIIDGRGKSKLINGAKISSSWKLPKKFMVRSLL